MMINKAMALPVRVEPAQFNHCVKANVKKAAPQLERLFDFYNLISAPCLRNPAGFALHLKLSS